MELTGFFWYTIY